MEIKFITEKLNNKKYIEMIDEQISANVTQIAGNKIFFNVIT